MITAKEFISCLESGDNQKAHDICLEMIEKYPQFSFYHYWERELSKKLGIRTELAIESLKPLVKECFKDYEYLVNSNIVNDSVNLEEEKSGLVKRLPYQGEIYLPTNKIDLKDQVSGLRKVHALVSEENKRISFERFTALKSLIKRTNKKRVFILGNGPSLKKTDLSLLENEITIGFNGIFLHQSFTPTIHIVEDHLVAEDREKEIREFECPVKMYPSYLGYCIPAQENTIFLNHLPRKSFPVDTDFSDDAANISFTGGTVTYTGLQVAASLGFSEIILVGVDASYKVEDVDRTTDYGTGVLCSRSDDVNHFDPSYFGKGYRWHDPNVHTMLQAYRKARNYAERSGKKVLNATIGGELEVFPRVNFWDLFDYKNVYPKTAIIDFTHIEWRCATGIVKKNMFNEWGKHSLFHVHAQNPNTVSTFQRVANDCYAGGMDKTGVWAALRSLLEYNPDVLYLRPTHDRPALTMLQLIIPAIMNKPFVIHYMDDWMAKIASIKGPEIASLYQRIMRFLFQKANKVLTISSKMSKYLEKEFSIESEKLQVVHNYMQPNSPIPLPKNKEGKVVRYFGGMEPDMSLASIHSVAKAIETLNKTSKVPIRFEIYTNPQYLEKYKAEFSSYKHTILMLQHSNYSVYLALLENSDLNVLCYNFDEKSEVYLRYSMANKLPENISANVPFLAIGSEEIGTITFLAKEKYPFLVTSKPEKNVLNMLNHILFEKTAASEQYFEVLGKLKTEFSEDKNRCEFQNTLRTVAKENSVGISNEDEIKLKEFISELDGQLNSYPELQSSLKILVAILELSPDERDQLIEKIHSHGIDWQFKSMESDIRQNKLSKSETFSYLITSLAHERFSALNNLIMEDLDA